jgi:hypothetical protein
MFPLYILGMLVERLFLKKKKKKKSVHGKKKLKKFSRAYGSNFQGIKKKLS